MKPEEIETFINQLPHVESAQNMGYSFFFVGKNHFVPFATIGYEDNEGDNISNLNREGVFRVNIGVSKETFDSLFPDAKTENDVDYTALDVFMPHPHYARQFYICILNPSKEKEEQVKQLIVEAYNMAKKREGL